MEILKRDKLDYVFQSLAVISVVPILCIQPLKSWAVSNFSFTNSFYNGKLGFIAQLLLIIATFICYLLTRKLKDNNSIKSEYGDPNRTWQMKLYRIPFVKKIMDLFIPKTGTAEYKKDVNLLKDAASKQKMEAFYVSRMVICIIAFLASLFLFTQIHNVAIDYIYESPSTDDALGGMSTSQAKKAMQLTKNDNYFLDKFRGKKVTLEQITAEVKLSGQYKKEKDITEAATRIEEKLKIVNKEYLKWFEWLLAFVFAIIRIFFTKMDFSIPKNDEKIRYRK